MNFTIFINLIIENYNLSDRLNDILNDILNENLI